MEEETGKGIDVSSHSYNRLMNHVRYMVARAIRGEKLKLDIDIGFGFRPRPGRLAPAFPLLPHWDL